MINFQFDFYEKVVWVATIIMCIIAYACMRAPLRKPGGIGQPLPNPISLIIPIVFFVLFTGLRKNIGDTYFYVLSFEEYLGEDTTIDFKLFFTEMFSFFQNIIRRYTDDGQWLVFFSGLFAMPVPLYILYKYSYPYHFSLFLFVATGYVGGMMNGMRQYMAAAITLCATRYLFSLKRGSFIKYAAIIMLGWSMHHSAAVLIPLYFVFRRKAWQMSSYIVILGSVVATVAFDDLLPSFLGAVEDTSYSQYATNGWFTSGTEGGSSVGRILFAAIPIVIAFLNREKMQRLGHIGDVLTNIAFVNAAIYIIATYNWIFVRFTIYLIVYYIIFTGWVVYNAVPAKDKSAYVSAMYIMFFLYSRFLSYQIAAYESDYFFPGRKLFR